MSDLHVRLLRRVAALRRGRLRRAASSVSADAAPAREEERSGASARADAQLSAAMNRRRQRAEDARTTPPAER